METTNHNTAQLAADALLMALQRPSIDEAQVIALIQQHAPRPEPRTVSIQIADRAPVTTDRQHFKMELLLTCLINNVHVMLVGEAGSGKTSAAHNAAEILGLPYYAQSFCATTSKSDLQGYMNASGGYVTSNFRRAFEAGGLFCADEFDAGNANSNTVINQSLANGEAGFPDGMTKRHSDFLVVACANTYGKGATAKFVGRNKLDAATLDRFAVISWDIDEALEASMIGIDQSQETFYMADGGTLTASEWLDLCRTARSAINAIGAELIVSPRAVQNGATLAAAGVGRNHLLEMFIFKGCDSATRAKLEARL